MFNNCFIMKKCMICVQFIKGKLWKDPLTALRLTTGTFWETLCLQQFIWICAKNIGRASMDKEIHETHAVWWLHSPVLYEEIYAASDYTVCCNLSLAFKSSFVFSGFHVKMFKVELHPKTFLLEVGYNACSLCALLLGTTLSELHIYLQYCRQIRDRVPLKKDNLKDLISFKSHLLHILL